MDTNTNTYTRLCNLHNTMILLIHLEFNNLYHYAICKIITVNKLSVKYMHTIKLQIWTNIYCMQLIVVT